MKSTILLFVLYFTLLLKCSSQNTLNGTVQNKEQIAIAHVSVCLIHKTQIIAYNISSIQGIYSISIPSYINLDSSFSLQFTCIGYLKNTIPIINRSSTYNVQLTSSITTLPDIIVQNNSVMTSKGDTTNFIVNAFTQKQDRVIGDVLKKMPGIDVDQNGRILYNGKAISNFYIDGDDLLGDRYNIASNSMPAEMVDKVQILENHQPIKSLKNIINSNNVALNLKLKSSAKLSLHGTAAMGVGIPKNYDATLNTLGFFKKQKFINTIKTNNIGLDIKKETLQLNYKDYLNRIEKEEIPRMLSPEMNTYLPINQNNVYKNNSFLVNINELINIKKDIQLRTNLFYLPENVTLNQNNATTIYNKSDTIFYKENQHSKLNSLQLFGELFLTINKPNFYINEKLTFQTNKNKIETLIQQKIDTIHQNYNEKSPTITNDFSILKVFKKKNIVEFFSYFSYTKHPENTTWQQGIFANSLNDSLNYASTKQSLKLSTLFTNNYFSFSYKFTSFFLQSYIFGYTFQEQNLMSNVGLLQYNNNYLIAVDSFTNNYLWNKRKAYFTISNQYKKNSFSFSFKLPINYLQFTFPNKTQSNFVINPQFTARYEVGKENSFITNLLSSNTFGNIQSLYQGYIIQNYRTIVSNNGVLNNANTKNLSVGFNFKKSAKIFYMNFLLGYTINKSNTITSNFINDIGDRKILIPFKNEQNNYFFNIGISKYIFKIGTTLKAKFYFENSSMYQIINNNIELYKTKSVNFNMGVSFKKSNWYSIVYNGSFSKSSNKLKNSSNNEKQNIFQLQQTIEYYIFPNKRIISNLTIDQFYNKIAGSSNKINLFFIDYSIRYKLLKSKTDFEISCSNILNIKEFYNPVLNMNYKTETRITLNPRIIMLKIYFIF